VHTDNDFYICNRSVADLKIKVMNTLALLSIIAGAASLLSLLLLHFASPEYKPSWRMVSEYALGKHEWLLMAFFFLWGASSILLALALIQLVNGIWAYLGIALLFVSGVGAIFGGLFNVNHKKHGLAFALGVPTLPVAALLLNYHLLNSNVISQTSTLYAAHATWLSVVLMGITMMMMFAGFKKAGVTWDKDSPPPTEVPKGVIALGGYANRLLVFCYIFWVVIIAYLI
jgi:hypothetical membrane protein